MVTMSAGKIPEALLLFSHRIELENCVEAIRAKTFTPFRAEEIGIGPRDAGARTLHLLDHGEKPGIVLSLGSAGWLRRDTPPSPPLWIRDVKRRNEPRLRPTLAIPRTQLENLGWYSTHLLTVDRAVLDQGRAFQLAQEMQVDAADMETWAIVAVCVDRNVPCAAVRVVTDRANAQAAKRYRARVAEAMRLLGASVSELLDWYYAQAQARVEKG